MRIAVYAIAKNEAQFVDRWYDSVRHADVIVVVDTGSTDDTVARLRKKGVTVYEAHIVPFRFDVARNTALSLIPPDVDLCLTLDMDEVMRPGWKKALACAYHQWEICNELPVRVKYPFVASHNSDGSPSCSLFRDWCHARDGFHWENPVHEALVASVTGPVLFLDAMECHHYPDEGKSRAMYLPLLKMAVEERPDDPRRWFYYARELMYYGQYVESTEAFQKYLELPGWNCERGEAMRLLAIMNPMETEMWLTKAVAEDPTRRDQLVDLAQYHYNQGNFQHGLQAARQALAITDRTHPFMTFAEAWGSRASDIAAVCAYYSDDKSAALAYAEDALALNPGDERLQQNVTLIRGSL